jgi:hypothetical protein
LRRKKEKKKGIWLPVWFEETTVNAHLHIETPLSFYFFSKTRTYVSLSSVCLSRPLFVCSIIPGPGWTQISIISAFQKLSYVGHPSGNGTIFLFVFPIFWCRPRWRTRWEKWPVELLLDAAAVQWKWGWMQHSSCQGALTQRL